MFSYPQQGVGGAGDLPDIIANVLTDHNKAGHDALNIRALDHQIEYACRAYRNANQNILDNTWTKILFNAEVEDIGGNFRADGVNSDFTVPQTAHYFIICQVQWTDNPGNHVELELRHNGSVMATMDNQGMGNVDTPYVILTRESLNAGREITAWVYQNSGIPKTVAGIVGFQTFINIFKIGV